MEKVGGFMMDSYFSDLDLAAALFFELGFYLPHKIGLEEKAKKMSDSILGKEQKLHKIIELCGKPTTPKQYYILEKAYSWLGASYRKQVIEFASLYLRTDGWKELPHGVIRQDGILIDYAARNRASVIVDLAQAQELSLIHI